MTVVITTRIRDAIREGGSMDGPLYRALVGCGGAVQRTTLK